MTSITTAALTNNRSEDALGSIETSQSRKDGGLLCGRV
jgi:hypothetical protein